MLAAPDPSTIGRMPLFQGLTAEQLARVGRHLRWQSFPADAHIMSAGQPGEVAYLILSGTIKVHVEQADGRDVIVALRGPGELLGELSLRQISHRSQNPQRERNRQMLARNGSLVARILFALIAVVAALFVSLSSAFAGERKPEPQVIQVGEELVDSTAPMHLTASDAQGQPCAFDALFAMMGRSNNVRTAFTNVSGACADARVTGEVTTDGYPAIAVDQQVREAPYPGIKLGTFPNLPFDSATITLMAPARTSSTRSSGRPAADRRRPSFTPATRSSAPSCRTATNSA